MVFSEYLGPEDQHYFLMTVPHYLSISHIMEGTLIQCDACFDFYKSHLIMKLVPTVQLGAVRHPDVILADQTLSGVWLLV